MKVKIDMDRVFSFDDNSITDIIVVSEFFITRNEVAEANLITSHILVASSKVAKIVCSLVENPETKNIKNNHFSIYFREMETNNLLRSLKENFGDLKLSSGIGGVKTLKNKLSES